MLLAPSSAVSFPHLKPHPRCPLPPLPPFQPPTPLSLDLLERGYEVHVAVDGVSSQRLTDRGEPGRGVGPHALGVGASRGAGQRGPFGPPAAW
jgi:hypothetical protein